ncbi:hypothetical protein V8E36_001701 [Tilletia maclaganii]
MSRTKMGSSRSASAPSSSTATSMAARVGALLMLSLSLSAAAAAAADSTSTDDATSHFTLFHRSLSHGNSNSAWEPRARIALVDRATTLEPYLPPSATYEELMGAAQGQDSPLGQAEAAQAGTDLYQLLLVSGHGEDASRRAQAAEGPLTSVKKCHLVSTSSKLRDELTIHLPSLAARSRTPVAISYTVPGLVLDSNACPLPESGPYAKRWTEVSGVDTTIRIAAPVYAAEPPLRAPIPVKKDGTPEVPPPEKSFLQKYWMYLLPVLILMFIPAEAEHSGSAEHDSSSNRAAPRELAAQRIK